MRVTTGWILCQSAPDGQLFAVEHSFEPVTSVFITSRNSAVDTESRTAAPLTRTSREKSFAEDNLLHVSPNLLAIQMRVVLVQLVPNEPRQWC